MWLRALIIALLLSSPAFAQAPPSTGGYTFQGQGNLPAILSSLANPLINQIPIGNGQTGYSLVVPNGDLIPSPDGPLGDYNVAGAHWTLQTCSTTPCSITASVVLCNAASGPQQDLLPGVAGQGQLVWIIKVDGSANACNITAAGTDTINFNQTVSIGAYGQSVILVDTGEWQGNLIAPVAASNSNASGFPLTGTGNGNHFSINNLSDLMLSSLTPATLQCNATCTGTCATTYTYEDTATDDLGFETQPSSTVTCTNASVLSGNNKNVLTWTQTTGQKGLNLYGRVSGSLGLITSCNFSLGQCAGNTFTDEGTYTPGNVPPSYNHTGKIHNQGQIGAESFDTANVNINSLNGTVYIPFSGSAAATATEALTEQVIPVQNTLINMYCSITNATTGTFTLRDNGSNTPVTCTITSPATACNDTLHAQVVNPGDLVDYGYSGGNAQEGSCATEVLK